MSLTFAKPIKYLTATHYVKDQPAVNLDVQVPFFGVNAERTLQGGGRTIYFLADDSLIVAELDPSDQPAKRSRPEAPPALDSSGPRTPSLAGSSSQFVGSDTRTPSLAGSSSQFVGSDTRTPSLASSSSQLVSSPSPVRRPQRPFKLLWDYSENSAEDCSRTLCVVGTYRDLYHGLAANNVCFRTTPAGAKPARGDWVVCDSSNVLNSRWTSTAITDEHYAAWCSTLLRNIFVNAAPAGAKTLPESNLLEKHAMYQVTVAKFSSKAADRFLHLENGLKIKLDTGALAVVNQLPRFFEEWHAKKAWYHINQVVIQGYFHQLAPEMFQLRGSICFVLTSANLEPVLDEFPQETRSVLKALASSQTS